MPKLVFSTKMLLDVTDLPPSPEPSLSTDSSPDRGGAAASSYDSLVGTQLADRYEVIRRIGEGGMGAVYEARHSIIGKRVAIKVLLEKFLENEEFVARLLQEARLASSIGHPNIVDVTDFGTTRDGRAFVVMEYLEGEPLSALVLRDAPLAVDRSLRLIQQVASALVAAHAKGIVHRDVKPENVYLVHRGEEDYVKVVDFGVSKAVHAREEANSDWQRLTRTGAVLGTPLFMSPEQASGREDIDQRADIWAVGLMLYECLTGELPFRANNYLGVLAQIQNKEPEPPSVVRPELGIPLPVDRVVMHALEKDRRRRYQSMAEFGADVDHLLSGELDRVLEEAALPATPAPKPQPRWRWQLALVLGVVSLAGLVIASVGSAPPVKVAPQQSPAGSSPPTARPRMASPNPRAAGTEPRLVVPTAIPVEGVPAAPVKGSPKTIAAQKSLLPERQRRKDPQRLGQPPRATTPAAAVRPSLPLGKDDRVPPVPYPSGSK